MKTNTHQPQEIQQLLIYLDACSDAREWAKDKSWKEIYTTCHRGDWLLWLFARTNPDNLRELALVKAHCANTVRHLMKDKRSTDAVDAAISFGLGEITLKQLTEFRIAAADAADAIDATAYYAAYAAYAAASTATFVADDAASTANLAADDAKKQNQKLTANICRQYLPMQLWNISQ